MLCSPALGVPSVTSGPDLKAHSWRVFTSRVVRVREVLRVAGVAW